MGTKKQLTYNMNWQSSTPVPFSPNTAPTGVLVGAMASTNTVYSNIQDLSNFDNAGLELTWTAGDTGPTGTIQIMCSNSGLIFYPLTFSPALSQPTAAAGGYLIDLNQIPFRYMFVQYTNVSGTGNISAWITQKDIN